jgi:4-hydroxyproline epimerase
MQISIPPTHIQVIDSHTGGEPTRVVLSGGPDLGSASIRERAENFRKQHDTFRSAVVREPRGSDVLVGALLCEPADPTCSAGVIFFNNVGYLGMCGHGTIGLIATLAHLNRIAPGEHRVETPVGVVSATLHASGKVTVENVPSFRTHSGIPVDVPGFGVVRGDVAWGGNWFFLIEDHPFTLTLDHVDALTAFAWAVRLALAKHGITGTQGEEIDHIELFGPAHASSADSRNFVLCPGKAYDRSPCGTGTSAKLACLYADGKLRAGQLWRQEGILGTAFEGTLRVSGDLLIPSIMGAAYITAEATLILDSEDPFRMGI